MNSDFGNDGWMEFDYFGSDGRWHYNEEDSHECMDAWDDPNDCDIGGNEPEDDPYASEWREDEDFCDHH